MYVYTYLQRRGGEHRAYAVRPWGWSEGQGHALRGACAESFGTTWLTRNANKWCKFYFYLFRNQMY